jgi:hypothetical protein
VAERLSGRSAESGKGGELWTPKVARFVDLWTVWENRRLQKNPWDTV